MYDDPAALAAAIEQLAATQRGRGADAVRANLLADVDRLRGGTRPSSMDKYLPLIYEPADLFTYLRGDLVLVSEPAKLRERLRTTQWQLNQDIEELLKEGLLCRG